jgi:AcrR family transcriptional regulator
VARKPADQSVSREDILEAAADVLRRNGYELTTMKDIAAEVNLTAASLYHHFRNKDTLLLAVLEIGLEHVIGKIEPLLDTEMPPDKKLRDMIHAHIVGLTQNTAVAAAMVFEISSLLNVKPPPAGASAADREGYADYTVRRDAFFARRDRFEDLFRCVVQEGIQSDVFRPVDVGIFTKALLGAHNWVGVWYREGGRLNGAQIADLMADTFLRSLQT